MTKGTKTRSKLRQLSGMVGPFGRQLPLYFDRFMVALMMIDQDPCLMNSCPRAQYPSNPRIAGIVIVTQIFYWLRQRSLGIAHTTFPELI